MWQQQFLKTFPTVSTLEDSLGSTENDEYGWISRASLPYDSDSLSWLGSVARMSAPTSRKDDSGIDVDLWIDMREKGDEPLDGEEFVNLLQNPEKYTGVF